MSEAPVQLTPPPEGYAPWLADLKTRIHSAQQRASRAVNRELLQLYWSLGRDILIRQAQQGWGAKVIDRLSADLRATFPDMKGFSTRNLKYMRAFAEAWPDEAIVQGLLAQLPWYHHRTDRKGTVYRGGAMSDLVMYTSKDGQKHILFSCQGFLGRFFNTHGKLVQQGNRKNFSLGPQQLYTRITAYNRV